MSIDETFELPDWRDNRLYDYTAKLTRPEWAWEFLRRNSDFRAAWRRAQLEYGIVGYDDRTTMLVCQSDAPSLLQWGLLYSTAPDQDARMASVFWTPEVCSGVLRLTGFPLNARMDATTFLLRDMSCASVLLEMPNGPQNLLFVDEGRGLQLVVAGADVTRPVRLVTDGAPKAERCSRQLRALQCFNELRLTGRLPPSRLQRDPLSPRLRHVLRVLDGDLSGASLQLIAQGTLGNEFTPERWQGRARTLRDRIRRSLRRGYFLMRKGYRDFLS